MHRDKDSIALRRLVSRLARARPADIEAVLDALDENKRTQLQSMLEDYAMGESGSPSDSASARGDRPILDHAPWLAQRMEPGDGPDAGAMTEHARRILRETANELAEPAPQSRERTRHSLLGSLVEMLFGRRHAA